MAANNSSQWEALVVGPGAGQGSIPGASPGAFPDPAAAAGKLDLRCFVQVTALNEVIINPIQVMEPHLLP